MMWASWIGYWPPQWVAWVWLLTLSGVELVLRYTTLVAQPTRRSPHLVLSRTLLTTGALGAPLILLGWRVTALAFGLTLALITGVLLLISPWLRDVLLVVVLAYDKRLRAGVVRLGEAEGHVEAFAMGRVILRAQDGAVSEIPASRALREPIHIPGEGYGEAACSLELALPHECAVEDARYGLKFLVLCSVYSSPRHQPEVLWLRSDAHHTHYVVRCVATSAPLREHLLTDVAERFEQWVHTSRLTRRETP